MVREDKDRDTPPDARARVLGERYGDLHGQLCDKGEASLARALAARGDEARLAASVYGALGGDARRLRRFCIALERLANDGTEPSDAAARGEGASVEKGGGGGRVEEAVGGGAEPARADVPLRTPAQRKRRSLAGSTALAGERRATK